MKLHRDKQGHLAFWAPGWVKTIIDIGLWVMGAVVLVELVILGWVLYAYL